MTKTKAPATASQPTQLSLLGHMTYNPGIEPVTTLTQTVNVVRKDELNRDVIVKTKFTISMPPGGDQPLPQVHHRHVLDAFVRDLVRLGVPEDDTIPFRPATTLREIGIARSGSAYEMLYEAIQRYFDMKVTFEDIADVPVKRKSRLPYLTGERVIVAYNAPKLGADGSLDGSQGWIRFGRWFTESLRDPKDRKYLSQAILSSFKIGETRRIYELVKKFMGSEPKFEIGITKLAAWIPYAESLPTREQVQKAKRAIDQLLKYEAFPRIELRGRGQDTIITFFNFPSLTKPGLGAAGGQEQGDDDGQADHGAAGIEASTISALIQLMTEEAKQERRAKAPGFADDLAKTGAIVKACVAKFGATDNDLVDAWEDTRVAYREGKVKTTVRQHFLDLLKGYTGNRKPAAH